MKSLPLKSIVSFLLLIVIQFSAIGQDDQIGYSDGYYYFQSQRYKIQDLGGVIYHDPTSAYFYSEGIKHYSQARKYGVVGTTGIGVGILSFLLVEKESQSSFAESLHSMPNALYAVVGIAFAGTGVVFSIAAFNNKTIGTKLMQKSIETFNAKQSGLGRSLQLELRGDGIGLCLRF